MTDIRNITDKDLEIAKCNPIKHRLIPDIYNSIYSSGNSDIWHCYNCRDHGDKWYMLVHDCTAYYEFHYNSQATQKLNKKDIITNNETLLDYDQ